MPAFAAVSDLSAFVGFTVDPTQGASALDMASDEIRAWTGRQIDYITDDVYIDQSGQTAFLLPELPVTAVSNVQILGDDNTTWVTLDPTIPEYSWDRQTGLINILSISQGVQIQAPQVKVTYDHGYQSVPSKLQRVCVKMAARSLANPHNVLSQATGMVTVRFNRRTLGVSELTDTEQRVLDRYTTVTAA